MRQILTTAGKELLLLGRDRTGLLVLFLMPALLVIIITLVQQNVMELTGQMNTRLLFLDLDAGEFGNMLRTRLAAAHLEIVAWDREQNKLSDVQAAVGAGDYQVGLVIPVGSSDRIQQQAALLFAQKNKQTAVNAPITVAVDVFFDPGIMPGLRSGLSSQLRMAVETIALEAKLSRLDSTLGELVARLGNVGDSALLPQGGISALIDQPLVVLREARKSGGSTSKPTYNPVQQNVPAWALFGMFFTAIPIAGAILQERKSGIWMRLASLPVSHLHLFAGKIVAYMGVCLGQFLLIALIGTHVFPHLGLPAFMITVHPLAVLLTVLFSSLAACGFGILLGMLCRTYEQASTLGATAVVASAAMGGVMVPVYAMPQIMQRLSIISPLNWGLTAFHEVLVRGLSYTDIADDLGRLALFFCLMILVAWKLTKTRL